MKRLCLILLFWALGGVWLACAKASGADFPLRLTVDGPVGLVAGDTLAYTISWTAPAVVAGQTSAASSYTLTLSSQATNGAWTTVADSNLVAGKWTTGSGTGPMPTAINVTTLYVKSWLSAMPWDSATFTATLIARNAAGVSGSVQNTWRVKHKILPPGTPGLPQIDSSTTVTGSIVLPSVIDLAVGGQRIACAFKSFSSGAVAEWTADKASCDSIYVKYVPSTARALVTPAQQAHTDSLTITCVSWASSLPAAVRVTSSNCSAAATVTGLGVTMRIVPDGIRLRFVDLHENDGPVLFINPQTGVYRCLRAGYAYVYRTAGGLTTTIPVTCNPPLPQVLAAATAATR